MNEVFTTLGVSDRERAKYDYYATDPRAVEMLLDLEEIRPIVLEPFCGEGHISKVLLNHGHRVISSDLIDRGFGFVNDVKDYKLKNNNLYCRDKLVLDEDFDIVTNPPYKHTNEFTESVLNLLRPGCKLIQFLKLQFLETKGRRKLFEKYPLKKLYVSSSRLVAAKNGDFSKEKGSAIAYGWFVWEKGYADDPIIKWFN